MVAALLIAMALSTQPDPSRGLQPVTVVMVDSEHRKPLVAFAYQANITTADPGAFPERRDTAWHEVQSPEGTFVLQAPPSCEIFLSIRARDALGGFGRNRFTIPIAASDTKRRAVLEVELGRTVCGTVRDAVTRQPVAGANVMPVIFTPPLFQGDRDRAVTTDARGHYELHGVDPGLGVTVAHPDYLTEPNPGPRGDEIGPVHDLVLRQGETFRGTVRDPQGNPLADVEVSDGAGKSVRTGPDGSFVLKSPGRWDHQNQSYRLDFQKAGFIECILSPREAPIDGLVVTLDPEFRLTGRVLTADGKPATSFTVVAGPGRNPQDYQCERREVTDAQGRFALGLKKPGAVWVGVRAPGHAFWKGQTNLQRDTEPLTIRLTRGTTVTGTVRTKGSLPQPLRAILVPEIGQRDEDGGRSMLSNPYPARELGTLTTGVAPDGSFRFEEVRPGLYRLRIEGRGITPIEREAPVPDSGLAVGTLHAAGTGRIVGRVFRPKNDGGGIWAFASGEVSSPTSADRHLSFTADEQGRFTIDQVPIGMASVGFWHAITSDMIGMYTWNALVVEGKATEVRVFDPRQDRAVTFQFAVGDGSPAQVATGTGRASIRRVEDVTDRAPVLSIDLTPLGPAPVSFVADDWIPVDEQLRIRLVDVAPGRYRVATHDSSGSSGFEEDVIADQEVTFTPDTGPIRVPLGAGSITGRVRWTVPTRFSQVQVLAVSSSPRARLRSTESDVRGNFCVRFLPEDTYTLFAYDPAAGWQRLGSEEVRNDSVEVGEHTLVVGGTVRGSIRARGCYPVPDAVSATHSSGAVLEDAGFSDSDRSGYVFPNLWPGEWTIALRSGDAVLATVRASVRGKETVRADLDVR